MGKTGISWTDDTRNVIRGCSRTCAKGEKISGCGDATGGGCYAERMAWRIVMMDRARGVPEGQGKYDGLVRMTANGPRWTGVVRLDHDDLMKMLRSRPRTHQRTFFSMTDVFHERLDEHSVDLLWAVMLIKCLAENDGTRTFQVLTKRIKRAHDYLTDPKTLERVARVVGTLEDDGDGWSDLIRYQHKSLTHPLIWIGTSVEHQAAADERIPWLLETPADIRFLSCEPLLGEIDISEYLDPASAPCGASNETVDWVIAGCESGPGSRPAEVNWFRALRDQCASEMTPFFLKQAQFQNLDRITPVDEGIFRTQGATTFVNPVDIGPGSKRKPYGIIELPYLDGVQHADLPTVAIRKEA